MKGNPHLPHAITDAAGHSTAAGPGLGDRLSGTRQEGPWCRREAQQEGGEGISQSVSCLRVAPLGQKRPEQGGSPGTWPSRRALSAPRPVRGHSTLQVARAPGDSSTAAAELTIHPVALVTSTSLPSFREPSV